MAEPIALKLAPRDLREALYHRLENAPLEHAEALLAAYEVLQGLQDRGVLEMLRGALGSRDKVLQILVDAVNTPEAIRGIRNFMILTRIFDTLEPELLEALAQAVPEGMAQAKMPEPLGLWNLLKKLSSRDGRRALTAVTGVLESLGKKLGCLGKRQAGDQTICQKFVSSLHSRSINGISASASFELWDFDYASPDRWLGTPIPNCKRRIKKLQALATDPSADLWALDEVHFQQHGSRCRMWVPAELKDPKAVALEFAQVVAKLVETVGFFGKLEVLENDLMNVLGAPTAEIVAGMQEDLQEPDDVSWIFIPA